MDNLIFLFAAYAIIWLAVLVYSFSIASRQKSLEREIDMLKAALAEKRRL
jgi:CcmD family protein